MTTPWIVPVAESRRCRCDGPLGPCSNAMTEEDLRCDACRAGCTLAIGPMGSDPSDDDPTRHINADIGPITFTAR